MSLSEIVNIMRQEYDSLTSKLNVQTDLKTLRLDSFMAKIEISSTLDGPEKLKIEIIAPSPRPLFHFEMTNINCAFFVGRYWTLQEIRTQ